MDTGNGIIQPGQKFFVQIGMSFFIKNIKFNSIEHFQTKTFLGEKVRLRKYEGVPAASVAGP